MNKFLELIQESDVLLADGAMGTMLLNAGLEEGTLPETWNVDQPEKVAAIHRASTLGHAFYSRTLLVEHVSDSLDMVLRAGFSNSITPRPIYFGKLLMDPKPTRSWRVISALVAGY